jgi:hypothetical protein
MLQLMDILLRALGTRILCLIALVMTFGLFAWAMWRGNLLAFLTAGAFGIGVLWPVLFAGFYTIRGKSDEK